MSMHPPPDPDELASDLVDGLLSADEAARLRSDPDIAARVRAIEAARAALRVPPAVAPGAVDRAMAATFAALDRGDLPGGVDAPPPPVTHLRSVPPPPGPTSGPTSGPHPGQSWSSAPAHAAPGRRRSGGTQWLAAAAAIVLIGLVTIGILSSGSDSGDASSSGDVAASAAPDPGTDAQAEAGGSGAGGDAQEPMAADDGAVPPGDQEASDSGEAATEGPTATTAPSTTDLGAVGNADELADRVRALGTPLGAVDTDGQLEPSNPDGAGPGAVEDGTSTDGRGDCPGLTDVGDRSRGETLYVADAVLAGNPVKVHVYDPGAGQLRLVATDRSCSDVVDVPFSR